MFGETIIKLLVVEYIVKMGTIATHPGTLPRGAIFCFFQLIRGNFEFIIKKVQSEINIIYFIKSKLHQLELQLPSNQIIPNDL